MWLKSQFFVPNAAAANARVDQSLDEVGSATLEPAIVLQYS